MPPKSTQRSSSKPPKRWQFIDLSKDSADNLTQVKRHVMQEYMRQKRIENHQRENSDDGTDSERKSPKRESSRRSQLKLAKDADVPWRTSTPTSDNYSDRIEAAGLRIVPVSQTSGYHFPNSDYGDISSSSQHSAAFSFSSSSTSSPYQDALGNSYQYDTEHGKFRTPTWPARLSPPQTLLSAARTDPFNTLPWHMTREDQHLFDFYVNEMPSVSYGHHFRSRKAHNWYTEVFVPEAMKGSLSFVNTVLVHAANTWAWVHNELETDSTLRYRQLAISMLRDHIKTYPQDMTDNVIIACMSAAALEDFDPRPGHKEISWIHMRQAQKLIRRRGGPTAFANTKLAMLINWQDYILAGYVADPKGFYFQDDNAAKSFANLSSSNPSCPSLQPSPPRNSASPTDGDRTPSPTIHSPEEEMALQCENFLNFLTRCEHLALSQRMAISSNHASVRYSAFGSGSTLHSILASPAEKRRTVTGDRKQFITRLAALMMLNAALWDYRSSIHRTDAFLEHAIRQLQESEVNIGSSIEALLQILLACKDSPYDDLSLIDLGGIALPSSGPEGGDFSQYSESATSPFARPWFVGRMIKVTKRLGFKSWLRINSFLFDCLTLQVQEHTILSWGHELRQEILSAPPTSYVMPALQEVAFLGI